MEILSAMSRSQYQTGYIALVSVIVLAFALSVITMSSGWTAWSAQKNAVLSESYTQSQQLGKSCARFAALRLLNDSSYTGPEAITLSDGNTCDVVLVSGSGPYSVDTRAIVNKSVASFRTELDGATLQIRAQSQSP
jgi:hypothetical protein